MLQTIESFIEFDNLLDAKNYENVSIGCFIVFFTVTVYCVCYYFCVHNNCFVHLAMIISKNHLEIQ